MPLTIQERAWLEKAEEAADNPGIKGEGLSIRIIVYMMREIVKLREEVVELRDRVTTLEGL